MTSKFMVNAAFEARLLLRPSHQPTALFGTVNKLGCPIPDRPTLPPILSSRSYSDSTSTPTLRLPKSFGSTEGSQSSGPEEKNWFTPKIKKTLIGLGGGLLTAGGAFGYFTQEHGLPDWHKGRRRRTDELRRESAIYEKLKKGPTFKKAIKHAIPRKPLFEVIRQIITPSEEGLFYPLIIGEHGTGKTSLIKFAVNGIGEPKGVIYIDVAGNNQTPVDLIRAMQKALGWYPDPAIHSDKPLSFEDIWQVFLHAAYEYEKEYEKVPVLIIDNVNELAEKPLEQVQDYAKRAADEETATVVFVSSEGRVPRRMKERSSWSRHGQIIEIGDVSKEEALQYLKLREIDDEQATQVYELVGGRMAHLKSIANDFKKGFTFEAIRQLRFSDAKGQLESAQILPGYRYHEDGAKIVRKLFEKGSISDDTYNSLVGVDTGKKIIGNKRVRNAR